MAVLERAKGRRGAALLRRCLGMLEDEPPDTRSELEHRILKLINEAGFPRPLSNIRICGYEVDICWQRYRLIVEADGRRIHATPQAFERDRQRDLDLERAGWHVIRVTWRQLIERPEQIIATLRVHLDVRGG
jgi:very-short-patch-repair endonuclease